MDMTVDMTVDIRCATEHDGPAIEPLLVELGYAQAPGSVTPRLATWLGHPDRHVLVAQQDRRQGAVLLGVAAVQVLPRFERAGSWANLVALVVDGRYRGQRVGAALVEAVDAIAADAGCDVVQLSSSRSRTAAHAFYRSLGFEDRCATSARFQRSVATTGT